MVAHNDMRHSGPKKRLRGLMRPAARRSIGVASRQSTQPNIDNLFNIPASIRAEVTTHHDEQSLTRHQAPLVSALCVDCAHRRPFLYVAVDGYNVYGLCCCASLCVGHYFGKTALYAALLSLILVFLVIECFIFRLLSTKLVAVHETNGVVPQLDDENHQQLDDENQGVKQRHITADEVTRTYCLNEDKMAVVKMVPSKTPVSPAGARQIDDSPLYAVLQCAFSSVAHLGSLMSSRGGLDGPIFPNPSGRGDEFTSAASDLELYMTSTRSDWTLRSHSDNCHIWTSKCAGNPFDIVVGRVEVSASLQQIVSLLSDNRKRASYDKMLVRVDEHLTEVTYATSTLVYAGAFPVSSRHFHVVSGWASFQCGDGTGAVVASRSVAAPHRDQRETRTVLARIHAAGFIVLPILHQTNRFEVIMVSHVNFEGNMPPPLINFVQTSVMPQILQQVSALAPKEPDSPLRSRLGK